MAPKKLTLKYLENELSILSARVQALETKKKYTGPTIEKVETYNGEGIPEGVTTGLKQNRNDMIVSMQNAVKILNPKLIDPETGRHALHNVVAVCGYSGMMKNHEDELEEMLDEAYAKIK